MSECTACSGRGEVALLVHKRTGREWRERFWNRGPFALRAEDYMWEYGYLCPLCGPGSNFALRIRSWWSWLWRGA